MQCRRSVRLCLLAAAQGDAEAQASLGYMFWRGEYQAEAVRFLRLAAAQGQARAQRSLRVWLSVCPNLAIDPAEGNNWMLMAAAQPPMESQGHKSTWATLQRTVVGFRRTEQSPSDGSASPPTRGM